ncbi:hypothetical protein [Cecembia lonarensis]|uniref:Uncharacterized protein n=1 Tax=Cecembia lonarensis (strain CCUG 58316 / KCTC 22772 / LW9) TaxID=1225176 RepID=K1LCN4_CECL9|nr:hypothetical protein [Cecembia lonarensis]EKB49982.1 hypothetical protein B879_01407 [Cecembia lonarensis LW9]
MEPMKSRWSKWKEKLDVLFERIKDKLSLLKKKVGIIDESEPISFDVAEFMSDTQQALEKLPNDYREKCEIKAIQDKHNFLFREEEMEKIEKCLEHWKEDRFVTAALVGEKGSGISSLVNIFLENHPELTVLRAEIDDKISEQDICMEWLSSLLQKHLENTQMAIQILQDEFDGKVIVLENLQHLFLKKVGGFEGIRTLFDIIASTGKQVFWIGALTPSSWNYLDKTVSIRNYFTTDIHLNDIKADQLKQLFLSKHKGYKLKIKPTKEIAKDKSFKKMSDKEQQEFLEEQFFYMLNSLSHGNLTLAQLYWVRAISTVENHEVQLADISKIETDFLENLNPEQLFSLQQMLIHDGLNIEDFASVTNQPLLVCRNTLIPMREKGLLIQPSEKYTINPVLYQPVYQLLKDKNFIH